MKEKIFNKWFLVVVVIVVLIVISLILNAIFGGKSNEDFLIEDYKKEVKKLNEKSNNYYNEINNLNNKIINYENQIKDLEEEKCTGTSTYTERSCDYITTFQFIDYCDYNMDRYPDNMYCAIFGQYDMGKEGPVIEIIDSNVVPKEFISGQAYEITYRKKIVYDRERKIFDDYVSIIKVEATDRRGMEINDTVCVLE